MAITVYTYNDKVLVNNDNGKWLKKAPPPSEVTIGTQVWKNSSLAIDDGGEGITVNDGVYYYTTSAAQRIVNSIPGWHIPSYEEFNTLLNYVGNSATERINALAANSNRWLTPGNDTYGFGMLPNGYYNGDQLQEYDLRAQFLHTYNNVLNNAYYFGRYRFGDYINSINVAGNYKCQVRLIKDS